MNYQEWLRGVPKETTGDPLWKVKDTIPCRASLEPIDLEPLDRKELAELLSDSPLP